jgi:hypothetical protein
MITHQALQRIVQDLDSWCDTWSPGAYTDPTISLRTIANRARAALVESEPSAERPNRLRVGDIWEFWTEVRVKGKKKPVEKLMQWEVIGWHEGQYAWELLSLDGEHREYLMEFAPSYEDMRFLGSKIND